MQTKNPGEYRIKLLSQIPDYYSKEFEDFITTFFGAAGQVLDDADFESRYMLDLVGVFNSHDWGLSYWEKALELSSSPSDSLSVRQGKLKSKVGGWGDFLMTNLQKLFADFGVQGIVIIPNVSALSVTIEYQVTGPSTAALEAANLFKPVHIEIVSIPSTGRTWADLNASGITWSDLNSRFTWSSLNA